MSKPELVEIYKGMPCCGAGSSVHPKYLPFVAGSVGIAPNGFRCSPRTGGCGTLHTEIKTMYVGQGKYFPTSCIRPVNPPSSGETNEAYKGISPTIKKEKKIESVSKCSTH